MTGPMTLCRTPLTVRRRLNEASPGESFLLGEPLRYFGTRVPSHVRGAFAGMAGDTGTL